MNALALTWNISKVVLIILCTFQVASALWDANQAARMLSRTEGPNIYGATQAPLDPSRVVAVLTRRANASAWWLIALCVLSLIPYAPERRSS